MKAEPFAWVADRAQRPVLLALTLVLVLSSVWLFVMDGALASPAAPRGIVSFELAGDLSRSDAILRSWTPEAKAMAMLIQGFDSLYLLVYPAWFSLAASRLSRAIRGGWRRAGRVVSWGVLFAAPLDALENYALVHQLIHGPSAAHASLAWWCAVPKFALVAVAAGYLVAAAGAWLVEVRGARSS